MFDVLFAVLFLFCHIAAAQEPKVRTSLSTNDTIWVGQKVTVVVEALAPGYFASAATFDLPDPQGLLLIPPTEHPVVSSETIDETSYTVQRHELSAFAQHAGEQTIPPFTMRFTFKRSPLDTNEISATLKTAPLQFTATLPPGAENLGTVISARDLKVDEKWTPEPGQTNVKAGEAFTRTITFSAPDVPGMVFPPFPAGKIDGLGIYTKREVRDQSERGALTGERRDTITYVCQRPGQFTIPAVRLTWWDLDAKQLRTADFPERTLDVTPNPALAAATTSGKAAGQSSAAGAAERAAKQWIVPSLFVIGVIAILILARRTLLRMLAKLFAVFRPVHLEPLNPISTGRTETRL